MKERSKLQKWVSYGAIVLVSGCIGAVLAIGGFMAISSWGGLSMEETPTIVPDIAVTPTATETAVASPTPEPVSGRLLYQAVVQITTLYQEYNDLNVGWTGSGSIISPDGYILTNAHVVMPNRFFSVDVLRVALTEREDREPVPRYYAEVVQADEALDIAVIRITEDMDGNLVDHASLNLPYVALGNADTIHLGDVITILGYPGIGGTTVTLTRGEVSGFTSEDGVGDRAFIKTSATIAGGNSGGLATDLDGYLIGIPTQLGYGGDDQFVECRTLADTNRDGVVDERDSCVPTGGFINALRPINLATSLIEAAKGGEVAVAGSTASPPEIDLPVQGIVIYEDDFSDLNSGWTQKGDSNFSRGYVDGEYHIEVFAKDRLAWATTEVSSVDTIVDVDAHVIKSASDGDYGVVCRYQDKGNFYGLEIAENGYFAIWKYVNGEYSALLDWQSSNFITQSGEDQHFTAGCIGDTLTLAINGELLAEVHDSDLTSGEVGMVVGTYANPGIRVGFDNFRVSSPSP